MGTENSDVSVTDDGGTNSPLGWLAKILVAVRTSFLNAVAALGVLMLLAGFLLGDGVTAGLLGILGVSALVYAGFGRGILSLSGYS